MHINPILLVCFSSISKTKKHRFWQPKNLFFSYQKPSKNPVVDVFGALGTRYLLLFWLVWMSSDGSQPWLMKFLDFWSHPIPVPQIVFVGLKNQPFSNHLSLPRDPSWSIHLLNLTTLDIFGLILGLPSEFGPRPARMIAATNRRFRRFLHSKTPCSNGPKQLCTGERPAIWAPNGPHS